jgi:NADPH:quinone reductase-like Zn-dependent oxidoreductase
MRPRREHAFNYKAQDWVAEGKRVTNSRGVNLILDIVGGDYIAHNLDLLSIEGRSRSRSEGASGIDFRC